MTRREREILEHAVAAVTAQGARADDLVDEAIRPGWLKIEFGSVRAVPTPFVTGLLPGPTRRPRLFREDAEC
jgi:hypothetical protein